MSCRFIAAIVATAMLAPASAGAETSVEEFYKANTVTMVVGYSPGAAYDLYARIVAQHIGRFIPGSPKIVVQNMPGAGSMNSVNYIYSIAKKDGTQLAAFARGIAMQPLLDSTGVKFDATKLNWIGSPSSEISVVLSWYKTPFKTIDEAKKAEMTVGVSGTGADSAIFPKVLNAVLGTKFRLVTGYPGNSEMLLAVERGEVDGNAGTSWATLAGSKREWIEQKRVNILTQIGLKKHPALPDVPLAIDMARSTADRQVLELIAARQEMAYPIAAPPGIPEDRLKALREAFDKMTRDPEFMAEAKRQGFDVDPMSGEDLTKLVQRIYASPADVIARARAAVE